MRRNLASGLKGRRRGNPMQDYDRLPPTLRRWLAEAALPWSAVSVRRAWLRALQACEGCEDRAFERLNAAQARLLARDAPRIWGAPEPPGFNREATR